MHTLDAPSLDTIATARSSARTLGAFLDDDTPEEAEMVVQARYREAVLRVPIDALPLLHALLDALAQGDGAAVVPLPAELTSRQAAALMGVSRTHLIGMLNRGELPYRRVGTHRRLRSADVVAWITARAEAAEALQAASERPGEG